MRKLIYSMGVSLDGFIAGPDGEIDWSAPDEELHRFHNEQARETGAHLYGRRLYETMTYWETAGENPSAPGARARVRPHLEGHAEDRVLEDPREGRGQCQAGQGRRRRRGRQAEGTTRKGPGRRRRRPGLHLHKLGLIDEYRLFVSPVVLGGGTPYFPALDERINLELVETRTFGSRVVYVRYRPVL